MNEYIIVNKTSIQKRIEELEKWNYMQEGATTYKSPMHLETSRRQIIQNEEVISELKQILSQSTPLIPEIEKSWEHGYTRGYNLACCEGVNSECLTPDKQDYISNLKLNI